MIALLHAQLYDRPSHLLRRRPRRLEYKAHARSADMCGFVPAVLVEAAAKGEPDEEDLFLIRGLLQVPMTLTLK